MVGRGATIERCIVDLFIVEDGKLVEYERLGECNQCGECCCRNKISAGIQVTLAGTAGNDKEIGDLSDWEGFSVFYAQGLWWWIETKTTDQKREKACECFIDGKCADWKGDDWPAICRYWPVRPQDIVSFPECGFEFRKSSRG